VERPFLNSCPLSHWCPIEIARRCGGGFLGSPLRSENVISAAFPCPRNQSLGPSASHVAITVRLLWMADLRTIYLLSSEMPRSDPKSTKRSPSGRVGGHATFAGITYQTEYAVLQTLDLISKTLVIHGTDFLHRIEPRVISGGLISSWDIIVGPPDQATEAKEIPNAADIVEFLVRVSEVPDSRVV
jgi:hypothetical protein